MEVALKTTRAEVAWLADDREHAVELFKDLLTMELSDTEREATLFSLGEVTYGLAPVP